MKYRNSEILILLKYDSETGVRTLFDKPFNELFIININKYIDKYKSLFSKNKSVVEERSIKSLNNYFSDNGVVPLDKIRPCYHEDSDNKYINYIIALRQISPLEAKIIYNKAIYLLGLEDQHSNTENDEI